MSKRVDDGGPAFPRPYSEATSMGPQPTEFDFDGPRAGMSLRDYFAARAPEPEPSFVCEVMGWEKDLRIGDQTDIGEGAEWRDSMLMRWHELPTAKRHAIIARHAYSYADAMIAARGEGGAA